MDEHDPEATDVDAYQRARGGFRTTLYATCGTPLSHAESIELFDRLGTRFAPELKTPEVEMPYQGDYTSGDPEIRSFLERFGRAGVPLNVIFPAGGLHEPIVLPPQLSKELLLEKLDEAGPSVGVRLADGR